MLTNSSVYTLQYMQDIFICILHCLRPLQPICDSSKPTAYLPASVKKFYYTCLHWKLFDRFHYNQSNCLHQERILHHRTPSWCASRIYFLMRCSSSSHFIGMSVWYKIMLFTHGKCMNWLLCILHLNSFWSVHQISIMRVFAGTAILNWRNQNLNNCVQLKCVAVI